MNDEEQKHQVENGSLPSKFANINQRSTKDVYNKIVDDIWNARKDLKTRHKIIYITLAFVGLNLLWFGVWTLVKNIPILSNPLVSIPSGIALLMLTGKVKDLA